MQNLLCKQFADKPQEVRNVFFALHGNLDGGLTRLFIFLYEGVDQLGGGFW